MFEGQPSPDEEVNAFIAGLSPEERAEFVKDRAFIEGLHCEDVGGMLAAVSDSLTERQRAGMADYLRFLSSQDVGEVVTPIKSSNRTKEN